MAKQDISELGFAREADVEESSNEEGQINERKLVLRSHTKHLLNDEIRIDCIFFGSNNDSPVVHEVCLCV